MRIELPLPAWPDTAHRADDDAHTLTVAPPAPTEWGAWQWPNERTATLRVEVAAGTPEPVTLTL